MDLSNNVTQISNFFIRSRGGWQPSRIPILSYANLTNHALEKKILAIDVNIKGEKNHEKQQSK